MISIHFLQPRGMLEPSVLMSLFESLLATERDPLAWVGHIAVLRKVLRELRHFRRI